MPTRAAQTLRETLEQELIEGRHRPGDRLDEAKLAKRFNVSRTPIREALASLATSGLIELRPRRGAFVRRIGARELVEMFEVMAELEAVCARFAARRADEPQLNELSTRLEHCARAAEAGDSDAYYYENELFHAALYRAAGNSYLEAQALALQARLKPFRRLQLRTRGRLTQSLEEHRRIVTAVRDGLEDVAADYVRAHIVIQGEKFTTLMASLERAAETASAEG